MSRILVIGDIHGRYSALIDVLDQAEFDYNNDTLVVLGDIVDGGPDTKFVVYELLKIKYCIYIFGNHCRWFMNWMTTGEELPIWVHQGGYSSMRSYDFDYKNIPASHIRFFENGVPFWIDDENRIYVHGGFDPNRPVFCQDIETFTWDRNLINYALTRNVPCFSHVFIGHTTTQAIKGNMDYTLPVTFNNLTALDTGAGWIGKLTIMDVDTMEYWQSEMQHPNKDTREVYTQYDDY